MTPTPKPENKKGRKKAVPTPATSALAPPLSPSPALTGDTLIRTGVAMSLLGVSHSTFNRIVREGDLPPCQHTPGGQSLFRYSDVIAYITKTNTRFADKAAAKLDKPTPVELADDDGSAL